MEYVDLYLIHHPVSMRPQMAQGGPVVVKEDLMAMDMKGVWQEMEECHRRGLARAIGVSNFSCKKLEYLLSVANIPPAANQVLFWFAICEVLLQLAAVLFRTKQGTANFNVQMFQIASQLN